MRIQQWSDDIVLVELGDETVLTLTESLDCVMKYTKQGKCQGHTVIDFRIFDGTIINHLHVARLFGLYLLLDKMGYRLLLSHLTESDASFIRSMDDKKVLKIYEDKFVAIVSLQMVS